MLIFRKQAAVMARIAKDNPHADEDELQQLFGEYCEEFGHNPYGVGVDQDEPKDHAYNDSLQREC